MKSIQLIVVILCSLIQASFAQDTFLNFNDAKATAARVNKNIILVFSGSDWCKPCITFKKEILEKEDVKTYIAQNNILLNLDFPYKKKNRLSKAETQHNSELADRYNAEGTFPKILVVDPNGKVLSEIAYKSKLTQSTFIAALESVNP